jgi:hypothetical protein
LVEIVERTRENAEIVTRLLESALKLDDVPLVVQKLVEYRFDIPAGIALSTGDIDERFRISPVEPGGMESRQQLFVQ